ncbi:MAG: ZIP family metal transporter [Nitrososphaerota archaeon]
MIVRSKITTSHGLLDSLVFGFIASGPLLIGCIVSLFSNLSQKLITTIMAFGSGVLIATLTFSILVEAFNVTHTLPVTVLGFILGGISYGIANAILERKSKTKSSKCGNAVADGKITTDSSPPSGKSLFIGSVMDNIPENAALGITLASGGIINIAFLVAIFVSNLPEGLASTSDMKSSGLGRRYILILWSVAVAIGTVSTAIGYSVLSNASPPIISICITFAAGAILVMLGESMIPEAFRRESFGKGVALLAGFLIAALLTKAQGG